MALGKFGRVLLYGASGCLCVLILAMLAATVALQRVPRYQTEIKAWVYAQTGLHIRFARVAPTWRWFGPELSFAELDLRSKDDRRSLARAHGGRIGVNVWRLLSGGKLFAGRVELDAPEIVVTRVAADRFVLGDIRLEVPAGAAGFALEDLPEGQLAIRRGRITVENWNADLPELVLDAVDIDAVRQFELASLGLTARLPAALGGALSLAGMARGAADPGTLTWSADLRAGDISFAGWHRLLPDYLRNLAAGTGAFELSASGSGRSLARAELAFDAASVVTHLGDGSSAAFDRISGAVALSHTDADWRLTGRRLQAVHEGRNDPLAQFQIRWRDNAEGLLELHARANYLRAETLFALTGLLPQQDLRDRLQAIAPSGQWFDARLDLARGSLEDPWRLDVRARFEDAGFAPIGTAPGLRGVSGSVAGDQSGGHVTLEGTDVRVSWPHQWPEPVAPATLKTTVFWRRDTHGLLLASPEIDLANGDAALHVKASLALPSEGDSPRLTLVAGIEGLNLAAAPRYLPRANLPVKVVDWLDRALVAGHVAHADAVLNGPVRHFPFRDGSGVFDVRFSADRVSLDYAQGWPPLEDLAARADFHNEGLRVKLTSAVAAGVMIDSGDASFVDFKTGELDVHLGAAGDASQALAFLRATPLDALADHAYSKTEASGSLRGEIDLHLPFRTFDQRRVLVHGQLDGVTLARTGLPLTATDMSGDFDTDGPQVVHADVHGRLLGGPFRLQAKPPRFRPATRTQLEFRGTFAGEAARAALGLPATMSLAGSSDWRGVLRMAADPVRERSLHLSANLAGLQSRLPLPLAKPAGVPLPSWANVDWPEEGGTHINFGLGAILRGRILLDADADLGTARVKSVGLLFGAADPVPNDTQVLTIGGHVERLDLGGWLRALPPPDKAAKPLTEYLHSASLQVDQIDYLGLRFRDVALGLSAQGDRWNVDVAGPDLAGHVSWPIGADPTEPWSIEFDELTFDSADAPGVPGVPGPTDAAVAADGGAARPAAGVAAPVGDPRSVPSVDFRAKQVVWGERHLGTVVATLRRHDDGVSLDAFADTGSSFIVNAHGEWRGKDAGTAHVEGTLQSSDVRATLAQLGLADVMSGRSGRVQFDLSWAGAPTADALRESRGKVDIAIDKGQLLGVDPGAGRVLGLASIAELPRRLALDFSDLTDKGLAFDSAHGSFDLHGGNAYTDDVLLTGPAADVGMIGRIGLQAQDYDQTAMVTGNYTSSLPIAGALAGGPVVGAAVLLFTQVFKQPLRGLARGYYRITGTWDNPSVERINSAGAAAATAEVPK
jgi:uncharacterized protein (TIGR02099 family)